jgi:hypothetical protein
VPPKGGGALGQGSDAAGGDPVAQEVQGLHPELALLTVDDKSGRLEPLKDVGDVQEVLLAGRTADEDIVEVGEGWGAVRHDPVHEALKRIARISHAKRHAGILVQPEGSDDRRLGNIGGVHRDLVVSLAEVDLREVPAAGHLGSEVHHVGQRVRVRDSDAVEAAVIPAGPPRAVGLEHHVERRCPGTGRAADDAVSFQGRKLGLGGGELASIEPPERRGHRGAGGLQVVDDAVGGRRQPLGGIDDLRELQE